jgi:hypothetical protein
MTEPSFEIYAYLGTVRRGEAREGYLLRNAFDYEAKFGPQHGIAPNGSLALLLPIEPADQGLEDRTQIGFSVDTFEADELKYIRLECNDGALARQFSAMVDNVLLEVNPASGKVSSEAVAQTIANWRKFFAPAAKKLDLAAQIGLLAELIFLESLILAHGLSALNMWFGPDKSRHDFVGRNWEIEVKATLRHSAFKVAIHGLHQLDSGDKPLSLLAYQFEKGPTGVSLSDQASRVLELTNNDARLISKLFDSGIPLSDLKDYEVNRFVTRDIALILVDEFTPRVAVVGRQALSAISSVQFDLNLDSLDRVDSGPDAQGLAVAQI